RAGLGSGPRLGAGRCRIQLGYWPKLANLFELRRPNQRQPNVAHGFGRHRIPPLGTERISRAQRNGLAASSSRAAFVCSDAVRRSNARSIKIERALERLAASLRAYIVLPVLEPLCNVRRIGPNF